MTPLITTPSPPIPTPGEPEPQESELLKILGHLPTDPWGHLWTRGAKAYALIPWDKFEQFTEPPILFLDESYDAKTKTFLYDALAFTSIQFFVGILDYIETLLVLRNVHPKIWPPDEAPPRLHLRELYPPVARNKTLWRHVPESDLNKVLKVVISMIRARSTARYIMPVHEPSLQRAVERAFLKHTVAESIGDLRIQAAAIQFRIALAHTLTPGGAPQKLYMVDL